MLKIRDFHKSEIFNSDFGTKALLDNIFRRIFFDYQSKNSLGWVGLNSTFAGHWLFKIENQTGVYCLSYRGNLFRNNSWRRDIYELQYFPDEKEEIVDYFSVRENLVRFKPNFDSLIRDFQNRDKLENLFCIGRIIVTINNLENYLVFSLWAPERWIEILKDGFQIKDNNGEIHEIVSKGGIDRDIPGFKLSYKFFDKLIATICYQMNRQPSCAVLKRRESNAIEIDSSGEINPSCSMKIFENLIDVCFDDLSNSKRIPIILKNFFPTFEFQPLKNEFKLQITRRYTEKAIFNGLNSLWWDFDNLQTYRKIPVIVITGFLGSGKTTLINQIVEYEVINKNKFIAIIQNEAGKEGIDGKIIDNAYTIETLDDGCICCGIRDKFINSVIEICNNFKPDIILLETSGIAEPTKIIDDLLSIPQIKLDSVITLVDCVNFEKIMKDFRDIFVSQIKSANIIILTKKELINKKQYSKIRKFLNTVNSKALIFESSEQMNLSLFMSLPISFDLNSLESVKRTHSHFHSKFFKVSSVKIKKILSYKRLYDFLNLYSQRVFRIKGILKLKEFDKPKLIQSVGGNFELTDYNESINEGILIFIGKDFSHDEILEFFKDS